MATLRIEHAIHDYQVWQEAFERFAQARERAGVTSYVIRRPADDANFVMLDLEFETTGRAAAFAEFLHTQVWSSAAAAPALAGAPRTRVLDVLGSGES